MLEYNSIINNTNTPIHVRRPEAILMNAGIRSLTCLPGFPDRPERIVGRVTTAGFVDHWAAGGDSFKAERAQHRQAS